MSDHLSDTQRASERPAGLARTRRAHPVEPLAVDQIARPSSSTDGIERVSVDLRGLQPLDALRLLLVADVLRRLLDDLLGRDVLVAVVDEAPASDPGHAPVARALGVRDPSVRAHTPDEAVGLLAGALSYAVQPAFHLGAGAIQPSWPWPRTLPVAPVTSSPGARSALSEALHEGNPLAVRLALLRFSHDSTATLSTARIHRAEETLQRWQFKVANWAEMPAAPLPRDPVDEMRNALLADLDTSVVLMLLHRLEVDPTRSSGSKFQSFAYLDRVLALDLSHFVGKLRAGLPLPTRRHPRPTLSWLSEPGWAVRRS